MQAGEILGPIGPNGAGKTALLEAIAGLLRVDSGEIRFRRRRGQQGRGYLDGKLYLQHTLPVSGKIGLWSKADSYMHFDALAATASE